MKIWIWLNGKKTTIGTVILIASMGFQAFFPELLTAQQYNFFDIVGTALAGFGLTHKVAKKHW